MSSTIRPDSSGSVIEPETRLQQQWAAVDEFVERLVVKPDGALEAALQAAEAAGLPAISVSPSQGKLLHLLARVQGARAILEIGTLAAYSTIWLARALPAGGYLVTLEADAKHAKVARSNILRAGLDHIIELQVGRALETLPRLESEGRGPFDLIFIDADKPNTTEYFRWARRLSRRGSLIIVDNVVRNGAILDTASADPNVQGMRRFHELVAADPGVTATVIQTVGGKGYDGFTIARLTVDEGRKG
jgi:predicted O-methyltransferase YrrM